MKRLHFFALKEDLLTVLQAVESSAPLKYIQTGNHLSPDFDSFQYAADIPNLGIADMETGSVCNSFLITEPSVSIIVRPVEGMSGIRRYCMDQLVNPDTVTLTPAGLWGEDVVLNGRVATVSESMISQMLMRRFNSAFRKTFSKIRAYWVGPEALTFLRAGKRLTASAQSPRDNDLSAMS